MAPFSKFCAGFLGFVLFFLAGKPQEKCSRSYAVSVPITMRSPRDEFTRDDIDKEVMRDLL